MRLTTVFVLGISLLLMLFAACQKTETIYCQEGIEGIYKATTDHKTLSNSYLEITAGTAKGEKVVLIRTLKDGTSSSTAVTAHWEEQHNLLTIPQQDYGNITTQVSGQLELQKGQVIGTLHTNQETGKLLQIHHQRQ